MRGRTGYAGSVSRMTLGVAGALVIMVVVLGACQRSDPPPGTPAQAAPCPEDAGTDLPRELACCLIQARTSEEAQICLSKADGGR